jgi:hypothetical protein
MVAKQRIANHAAQHFVDVVASFLVGPRPASYVLWQFISVNVIVAAGKSVERDIFFVSRSPIIGREKYCRPKISGKVAESGWTTEMLHSGKISESVGRRAAEVKPRVLSLEVWKRNGVLNEAVDKFPLVSADLGLGPLVRCLIPCGTVAQFLEPDLNAAQEFERRVFNSTE